MSKRKIDLSTLRVGDIVIQTRSLKVLAAADGDGDVYALVTDSGVEDDTTYLLDGADIFGSVQVPPLPAYFVGDTIRQDGPDSTVVSRSDNLRQMVLLSAGGYEVVDYADIPA
jgi:hypothetical protein